MNFVLLLIIKLDLRLLVIHLVLQPDKARTQNFTVAVSFGCERYSFILCSESLILPIRTNKNKQHQQLTLRDAAFEHAESKTVVSMPQPNGTIYTFGRDVNLLWRHGILQVYAECKSI